MLVDHWTRHGHTSRQSYCTPHALRYRRVRESERSTGGHDGDSRLAIIILAEYVATVIANAPAPPDIPTVATSSATKMLITA